MRAGDATSGSSQPQGRLMLPSEAVRLSKFLNSWSSDKSAWPCTGGMSPLDNLSSCDRAAHQHGPRSGSGLNPNDARLFAHTSVTITHFRSTCVYLSALCMVCPFELTPTAAPAEGPRSTRKLGNRNVLLKVAILAASMHVRPLSRRGCRLDDAVMVCLAWTIARRHPATSHIGPLDIQAFPL